MEVGSIVISHGFKAVSTMQVSSSASQTWKHEFVRPPGVDLGTDSY